MPQVPAANDASKRDFDVIAIPLSITDAAVSLRNGTMSSTELTASVLARADVYDDAIGSYLARFDDQAMAAAALTLSRSLLK
jgi:Asp-tRNA(Asn)/Glu-tRNA(Gln) amidotransferase A subunit family amidase